MLIGIRWLEVINSRMRNKPNSDKLVLQLDVETGNLI